MTSYRKFFPLTLFVFVFTAPVDSWAESQQQLIQNSIVRITATHNHPDYKSPWQRQGIHTVTGSGAIIVGKRILTNAHIVADETLLEVQREGSGNSYLAEVEYVCHSCDLALLTVDDPMFFEHATQLVIDGLPKLQSRVHVYGFPTGGETISISEGIVSRIEVDFYAHSADRYLLAQVDAAINPGNSGGPVLANGKIVGIAMQALDDAENIGYMVPTPIIQHFLLDIKDGHFDGFPELDIYVQLMENKALRKSLNLPNASGGLLVTGVAEKSTLIGIIKPGDVLLEIDGHKIGRDGKIKLNGNLRVDSSHLEYLKQIGEQLSVLIFRDGSNIELNLPLVARQKQIKQRVYDRPPSYFVFAGLVFQPLNISYLKANQEAQYGLVSYLPEYTLQGYQKLIPERISSKRHRVILLSRVMPDAINHGYKDMENSVVYSINGTPVNHMRHLIKLIESEQGPELKIITDYGNMIIINLALAKARNQHILDKYQIHVDRSADLK